MSWRPADETCHLSLFHSRLDRTISPVLNLSHSARPMGGLSMDNRLKKGVCHFPTSVDIDRV